MAAAGAALAVNLSLNVFLIPRYGILGAAVTSSLTYGFQAIWLIGAASHLAKAKPIAMLTSASPRLLVGVLKRALPIGIGDAN